MRKETEALKQARLLFAARSELTGGGESLDLSVAVSDSAHVAGRLIKAGLLFQSDWEEVARSDLRLASLSGPEGTLIRAEVRLRMQVRIEAYDGKYANVKFVMLKGLVEDLVSLVIEMAALKQAYDVMGHLLVDYMGRASKFRYLPDVRLAGRVLDTSYRTLPPEAVLSTSLAVIDEEKVKINWARTKMKRDRLASASSPKARVRSRDRRLSPSEVMSLFHSKPLALRLKRAAQAGLR